MPRPRLTREGFAMGWLFALCVCGPAFLLIVWMTQDDEPDETDDLARKG